MIGDQTTPENTPTSAIPFTVGDAETGAGSLTITASSSNTSLVPVANISFGGSGAARTVTVNPGASQSGSATITITVSDGTSSTSTTFNLIITPVNDAPTVTPIANQTTTENTPTGAIAFNIGDAETPAANLFVTGYLQRYDIGSEWQYRFWRVWLRSNSNNYASPGSKWVYRYYH